MPRKDDKKRPKSDSEEDRPRKRTRAGRKGSYSPGEVDKNPNKRPGGFLRKAQKPRMQKVNWNAENDRKLLMLGLERVFSPKEYKKIAESSLFPQKPTPKAIQERLTKLRAEQKGFLTACGLPQNSNQTDLTSSSGASVTGTPAPSAPPASTRRTGLDAFRDGMPLHILKRSQDALDGKEDEEEDEEDVGGEDDE